MESNLTMSDLREGHNYGYDLRGESKYLKCSLRRTLTEWLVTIQEGDMKGTRWVINENTISRLKKIQNKNEQ